METTATIKIGGANNKASNLELVTQELWKDIPEYEGVYQVSNTGK